MSAVTDLFDQIMKVIDKKTKKAGTNYTGKVTRVEGDTAYVQFDGSAINDTPVKMSIDAKPGDSVRIMVQGGKAWLTGNDTAPPTNDTVVINEIKEESSHIKETTNQVTLAVGTKMDSDMGNRKSSIVVDSGKIEFKSNTLVIDSDNFKLEEDGDATFSGTLSAAGGTFDGAVTFTHTYSDISQYSQTVEIGSPDATAPITIDAPYGNDMTVSIDIAAGYILLARQAPVGQTGSIFTMITPDGLTTYSDKRLKNGIVDLDDSIGLRLRPVAFRFNGDPDSPVHYGFIAQEVEDIVPGAVQNGPKGYLGLTYTELIAPTLALAQANAKRIKQLEDRIDMLSRRMDDGK